jgi:hypothetical protein
MNRQSYFPLTRALALFPVLLLIVNLVIGAKLFFVEYSAYLESNEGSFIAIARQIAAHPSDLRWWPLWDCGLPFQNTYLPLLHLLVGGFSRLTGHSAALSFHQVCAAFFCLGPIFVYVLAWGMTRRPGASFIAALAYSLVSPCAWLVPVIRTDLGSAWNLRRLQILAYYGEGPHTASLAFLPLAILCFYLALTRNRWWLWVGAGILLSATVLSNAFGAVIAGMAVLALVSTTHTERFWRNLGLVLVTGALAYCWISPLVPPSVIAAIRMNSPTVDGDYRFTTRSLAGVGVLAAGFLVLWWATKKGAAVLRFFLLFAFLTAGVVLLGMLAHIYVVPQPHRYQIAADMGLCLLMIFGGEALFRSRAPRLMKPAALLVLLALVLQFRHDLSYARRLIRATDMTATASYRVARWMDENMQGQRVMIPGSYSFQFNDFTDTPQLHGGQDPMLPNFVMRIATFVIYSGMNAGARDGEISVMWLKALGAHAVAVPGPHSSEVYKPFANPRKFEGLLPVLWSEGDDTIYSVPSRSSSLAHVLPAEAVVRNTPINGLDIGELERYVRALDNPTLPEAKFVWRDRHTADIQAQVQPGQVVSVQITYDPGWRAMVNGTAQRVGKDGLGMILVEPACQGPCEITLVYDGGLEWRATRLASLAVTGIVVFQFLRALRRHLRRSPPDRGPKG